MPFRIMLFKGLRMLTFAAFPWCLFFLLFVTSEMESYLRFIFSLYFVLWALKVINVSCWESPSLCSAIRGDVTCNAQVLCWLPFTNAFQQPRAQLLVPSMAQWPGRSPDTTLPLPRPLLVDTDGLPLWLLSFLLSLMLMEVHFILRIQVSLCFAGVQQQWSSFWRK